MKGWRGIVSSFKGGRSKEVRIVRECARLRANRPKGSKVVAVRSRKVQRQWGRLIKSEVERMLDWAITQLIGAKSPERGWEMLFGRGDVVAIKVNCIAGPALSSHPLIVEVICERLQGAGVRAENIYIYDRSSRELVRSGYSLNRTGQGVRAHGTDGDYGPVTESHSWRGRISNILRRATALINVPILKDHGIAGVTLALKNHLGTCDNPASLHPNHGDPGIAHLNAHPEIAEKTRLIVCDATRAVYSGGPRFRPRFSWTPNMIVVSTDPVALDSFGLEVIEKARRRAGLSPATPRAGHIRTAGRLGLGVADLSKVRIITEEFG